MFCRNTYGEASESLNGIQLHADKCEEYMILESANLHGNSLRKQQTQLKKDSVEYFVFLFSRESHWYVPASSDLFYT